METTTTTQATRLENATIYRGGSFGFRRIECRWVEWETKPFAQYPSTIHVRFVEKGKRKPDGFRRAGSTAPFVIIAGHGHPEELTVTFTPSSDHGNGVTSQMTRHSCFAPEWTTEFQAALAKYVGGGAVVVTLDATGAVRS